MHSASLKLKAAKYAAEKEVIVNALDRFGRSVEGKKNAARQLGISLTTLYARMNAFGIK